MIPSFIVDHRFLSLAVLMCLLNDLTAQISWHSKLDTVVVSSTLIPTQAHESGRNITVLDAEDIASMPFHSWDEILQQVPGLEVQSRNGFGAQADILLRGSTFTQVVILIDGMRLNDPLTGHFNGNIPIPLVEVERIEILRGPAAAMYGPDAVGGVVHFITKTWENPFNRQEEIPGQMSYGRNKLISADQGIIYSKRKFALIGGLHLAKSKGELIEGKILGSNLVLEPYRNYFDVRTLGFSGAVRPSKAISLYFRSAYDIRDFSSRYFYTNSPFDKSTEVTKNWWNQARMMRTGRKSSTELNLAYRYNMDEFIFSPDFPSTNHHISSFLNAQLNHFISINNKWSVKVGLQGDRRKIESNDRGNHQDIHTGVYAMSLWRPHRRITISGSTRLDQDENYGWEFSPQLNVSWGLGSMVIRSAIGRSTRAADYTERYVSNNLMNLTPGRSVGNPNLRAEQSWSGELGLDWIPGEHWSFKSTFFARQSNDLIDYVSTLGEEISPNENLVLNERYFYALNISDVITKGVEFELWHEQKLGRGNRLRLGFGYTLSKTTNKEDVISVYLSNHSEHLLVGNYLLSLAKLELGLTGLFKSRSARFAGSIQSDLKPNYMVFNGRLRYRISNLLSCQLQLNNILDEAYANILGAPMPKRWWMAGVIWDLKHR